MKPPVSELTVRNQWPARARLGARALLVCASLAAGAVPPDSDAPSQSARKLPLAGNATVPDSTRNAFGNSVPELSETQLADFYVGNSFFKRNWVQAPASTAARDGLGPLFNARSCAACHGLDGRGQPPTHGDGPDRPSPGLLMRLSVPGGTPQQAPLPEPHYGLQFATQAVRGVPAEGELRVTYRDMPGRFADGQPYTLREPRYRLDKLQYGRLSAGVMMSPRLAPQIIGMGLLQAIVDDDLLAISRQQANAGDGVRGRPNRVIDATTGRESIGRFGWKANTASLEHQVAAAFRDDMGITSAIFPDESCTKAQHECLQAPRGGASSRTTSSHTIAVEIDEDVLAKVNHYVRSLAVPEQRESDDPQVIHGGALFRKARCNSCHTEVQRTGPVSGYPSLSNQTIRPYTDLLLHDMGSALADGRPDHLAGSRDWRTPPLWGIGLIETVNGSAFFLHDGRARNLTEAILWHGGEAHSARESFRHMSRSEREALLRFLRSL